MYTYARPGGPNIDAFRRVRPRYAWLPGSSRPYASTSTIRPTILAPSSRRTRSRPRISGATSAASRSKNRRGRGRRFTPFRAGPSPGTPSACRGARDLSPRPLSPIRAGRPPPDLPGRGVPQDVDARVLQCPDDAAGYLVLRLIEVRVHRGNTHLEFVEESLVPVHRAVGLDVQLGAVQQHHVALVRELLESAALGQHLLFRHPLHVQQLGMVGDGVVG